MAKKNKKEIDFLAALGNDVNLFEEDKKLEKGGEQDFKIEKTVENKQDFKIEKTVENKQDFKIEKTVENQDFLIALNNMIAQRDDVIKDKSINQVHVNNLSKVILDRIKIITGKTITSITDALIIDYYINNKNQIDKEYKKLSKNSIF